MSIKSQPALLLQLSCLCLLLLLGYSCGSPDQVIGTYQVDSGESSKPAAIMMELKANGEGIWRVNDEEVPFAWYVKGGELRVNSKGGGVIVGTMEQDTIHISLPGTKMMMFKKVHLPRH